MKFSFERSVWSYTKVQALRSAVVRDRFMNRKTAGLYLDVGCGWNVHPQNINLDYAWRPGIDIVCDIRRGIPLPDQYVIGIFTEHCLEHISLRDCLFVLSECRRVLRPGAYLRIVVPDLEIYIQQYVGHRPMPYADDDLVDDLYSPAMSINRIMRAHGHQFIYDFLTLQKLLTAVGFIEVKKCSFGESSDPGLALDTPERKTESLYVEARRQTIPV